MKKERKKTWDEKVDLVVGSFNRAKTGEAFARDFYEHLFFLNPKMKKYFENTDFIHQEKLIMFGIQYLLDYLDHKNENARTQVLRLSQTHSKHGLNIYPHHYYYWMEALIMTVKKHDFNWYNDLSFYWREVIFYPISFMISQYYSAYSEK